MQHTSLNNAATLQLGLQVHPRVLSAPSTSGQSCVLHLLGQGLDGQSMTLLARANGSYADIEVRHLLMSACISDSLLLHRVNMMLMLRS